MNVTDRYNKLITFHTGYCNRLMSGTVNLCDNIDWKRYIYIYIIVVIESRKMLT